MKRTNLLFILLIFVFNYINAGGDDRDLGPVEVLDIIVEDSYKNVSPLSNQEKGIKIHTNTAKNKAQTKTTENITTQQLLDTIKIEQKIKVIETKVVEIEKPIVNKKVTDDAVYEVKAKKTIIKKDDFADKPVGTATAPLEDIGEKVYKNCEELYADSHSVARLTCVAIMGVFLVL